MKNIKKPGYKSLAMLLLILASSWGVFAEQKLPMIKADSKEVRIRISGNPELQDWYLMPEKKPDVYTLPRFTSPKDVTFITNRDSITFHVKPGDQFDFIILLNDTIRCYTRVNTLKLPYLLHFNIGLTVLMGLILITFTGYVRRDIVPVRQLLSLGILGPVFFWIATLCGGLIHGQYDHFKNVISELGALGRHSELFMTGAEVLIAIFCFFFSFGLYRICKKSGLSVIPVFLTLSMPVSILWAAVFPMGHEWHGILGPLPLLMNLGALLAFFLWKKNKQTSQVRMFSLAGFLVMSLILTRFIPDFDSRYPGLVQRFFYLGWTIWYLGMASGFMTIADKKQKYYL